MARGTVEVQFTQDAHVGSSPDTLVNRGLRVVIDKNGNTVYRVSGNLISNGSGNAFGRTDGWAYVDGDSITIRLETDYSVTRYGFKTDKASYQ